MLCRPCLRRCGGGKEIHEVTEALDDVGVKAVVGQKERNHRISVRRLHQADWRNDKGDRFVGNGTGGFDTQGRLEDSGEEQRVPCAPREELSSVHLEPMGWRELLDRESPESNDSLIVVEED